jgi:hypothetical protein
MAQDFFIEAAQAQAAEIDADIAEIDAGLARCRADGDDHSARRLIQGRAEANAKRRNLVAEYNAYVAANTPRQPEPLTEGEYLAMPADKMLQRPDAIAKLYATSRYYDPNDAESNRRYQAGLVEVQRRKADERKNGQ